MRRRRSSEASTCYSTTADQESQTGQISNTQNITNQKNTIIDQFKNKMQSRFSWLCDCFRVQNVPQQESINQIVLVENGENSTTDRMVRRLNRLFKYVQAINTKQHHMNFFLISKAVENVQNNEHNKQFEEFLDEQLDKIQENIQNEKNTKQCQKLVIKLLKTISNKNLEIDKEVPNFIRSNIMQHFIGKHTEKYLQMLPEIRNFLKDKKKEQGFLEKIMDKLSIWHAKFAMAKDAETKEQILSEIAFEFSYANQVSNMELREDTQKSK